MRSAAAQCELEGPRMTGPITSLNMLTSMRMVFSGLPRPTAGPAIAETAGLRHRVYLGFAFWLGKFSRVAVKVGTMRAIEQVLRHMRGD